MKRESLTLIRIRDVLMSPEKNPHTWFYLPPNQAEWSLDTEGVFELNSYDFPPDSDDYLPEQAKKNGWIVTLESADIEDVVENAKAQLDKPSLDQLFCAFIYYYENDAFFEF